MAGPELWDTAPCWPMRCMRSLTTDRSASGSTTQKPIRSRIAANACMPIPRDLKVGLSPRGNISSVGKTPIFLSETRWRYPARHRAESDRDRAWTLAPSAENHVIAVLEKRALLVLANGQRQRASLAEFHQ